MNTPAASSLRVVIPSVAAVASAVIAALVTFGADRQTLQVHENRIVQLEQHREQDARDRAQDMKEIRASIAQIGNDVAKLLERTDPRHQ